MQPRTRDRLRRGAAVLAAGAALAGAGYAAYAARTWHRYGRPGRDGASPGAADPLDRFMPAFDVAERHAIEVEAPAATTYAAARAMDVNAAPLARAIFAVRALPARLRGHATPRRPRSLVDETLALGWRILYEEPERVLVMGAVTQPWHAEVRFHGLPPEEFVAFAEPGWARIVWTLEAEPLGPARSRFVTRTRVSTTDADSRARFRRYWALMAPGIRLIRVVSLGLVKREAERRRAAGGGL